MYKIKDKKASNYVLKVYRVELKVRMTLPWISGKQCTKSRTGTHKYLGVQIGEKLSWGSHTDTICNNLATQSQGKAPWGRGRICK